MGLFEIHHQVEPVHQHVGSQYIEYIGRLDLDSVYRGLSFMHHGVPPLLARPFMSGFAAEPAPERGVKRTHNGVMA